MGWVGSGKTFRGLIGLRAKGLGWVGLQKSYRVSNYDSD